MDLSAIDHVLDEDGRCRVVIETPKGSHSKYTYDPAIEAFELSGLLPTGMSFPLDFGMVPGTLADDGDPLDILVLGDEPSAVGCVTRVQLLGVIRAEQTERGRTYRNDRLVARTALSINYGRTRSIDDLGAQFVDHVGRWFVQYNGLKGKGFEVLGVGGPAEAADAIRTASRSFAGRRP